ncbi:MAG: 4-hydroxythreonine-4-phosphate dehydrogenase PdxA, partial [Candidatus Omnitrophica bacterium]|nr:4-hydroxythreonine-4-phosphate dehydrogenase PdxA [Candidatus Omnitrophota bacterium]
PGHYMPPQGRIRIGITMGDPSGIGPEVVLKALSTCIKHGRKSMTGYVVIGDLRVMRAAALRCSRAFVRLLDTPPPCISFIDLRTIDFSKFRFGFSRPEYGRASIEYLDAAMDMISGGSVDCLVTGPICKESINAAGYTYGGHTEYLADRSGVRDVVMMLMNENLKFSLVTRHIALRRVAKKLNPGLIQKTVVESADALKRYFAVSSPRIVVCGLNPHASDNGVIGAEENEVISPAIKNISLKKTVIDGPLPSDIAVWKASQGYYDCVIAMFHDQALIPLKLTGADSGVNMTLGLPFVRTSPLHGTAFDIAGRGSADPSSFIAALTLAEQCIRNLKKD